MSSKNNPTRTRILSAALSLLETHDPAGTRMSDIAKAAGVSRQAVYLHFPNRAELLIATVRHVDEIKGVDARLAQSRAEPDGIKRLDAWVAAWGGYIPEIHGIAKALIALSETDPEARAAWDDRMKAVRHGCEAVVTSLERQGRLRSGLSPQEATDLIAGVLSIQTWQFLRLTCGWTQDRYIALMQHTTAQAIVAS